MQTESIAQGLWQFTWGDMSGGAEQIVTPFRGDVMLDLGMREEF